MKFPKNFSIDKKLRRVILLTSSVALLVAGMGFGVYDLSTYRAQHVREMENLAHIIGLTSLPAVQFQDQKTAGQILNALEEDPRIQAAALYDLSGNLFSYFSRPAQNSLVPLHPKPPGTYFIDRLMHIYHPLQENTQREGILFIESNFDAYFIRRDQYILIFIFVLAVSFIGAYFSSLFLQRLISRPILNLAETMSRVSSEKTYSHRAKKESEDEVGQLVDQFNEMLDQIEDRERALQSARQELEDRVRNRTLDLVTVNQRLKFEIGIRKRAEEILRSHFQVLEMLTAGHSLRQVLDTLNDAVEKQVGPMVICGILLMDEKREHFLIESAPHFPESLQKTIDGSQVDAASRPCGASIHKRELIIVEDFERDPHWKNQGQAVLEHGYRACWAVPIIDPKGEVLGTLVALCKNDRSPSVEETQILKSSAFLAGTAISRKKVEDELKSYARELSRSNQDLEDFASIASHDLQEPLRKVVALGQRLKEHHLEQLDNKAREYLDRMINASGRMKTFIDDLLDYSRVSARTRTFKPTNLNQIVADVLFDLEFQIDQTNATIEVDTLPMIEGDTTLLRQVFQNLIGNSLKFLREGVPPRIEIRYQPSSNGLAHITLKDNGIGFNESFRERIFKPFERLHPRNQFEGSGMGLALCKKIVDRHGGDIRAESKQGEGTMITLQLPLKQDSAR